MIEYAGTYLKKQGIEYVRILNVSDPVHSIRSLYKLLSSYRDRDIFRTLSNIERLAKRSMPECRCTTRLFQGRRGRFVELGHFDKLFIKNTRKRDPTRKHFEVFSLRYS